MRRFLLQRLLSLPLLTLAVTLAVFVVMNVMPGSTAHALLGPHATEERVASVERELGLDQAVHVRYARWLSRAARGELGRAYSLERPVSAVLRERAGPTLLLALSALLLGAAFGIFAGARAAAHRRTRVDWAWRVAALSGLSLPAFFLAVLCVWLFAVALAWLPASGMRSVDGGGTLDVLRHLVLPAFTLAVVPAGVIARAVRSAMIDAMDQDFVRVARAKGLTRDEASYGHALRAALPSVIPVIGLQAGFVLGGAVYVETVFEWPGLGRLLVMAIEQRDLILAQGVVLVMALAYVLVNFFTDLVHRLLDPRVAA